MHPSALHPSTRRAFRPLALVGAAGLAVLACSPPAGAGLGRWTPPRQWSQLAVHMALLPGDGSPYHSRVVWWNDEDSSYQWYGGQWGWREAGDNVDCASYPESKLDSLGLPSPGKNIFCAGLAHLPDGRLLAVGGTETGTENGLRAVNIFTPGTGTNSGSWSTPDSMSGRRWNPTATVHNDGRVLVTSGSKYQHLEIFGGITDAAPVPNDSSLARFGLVGNGVWDSPAPLTAPWPGPKFGHTAEPMPYHGTAVYFGGRTAHDSLSRTTRFQYRNRVTRGPDEQYTWTYPSIFVDATRVPPSPTGFHSAIVYDDENMVIYGGIIKPTGGPEQVAAKVFRLSPHQTNPYVWKWEELSTNSSPAPGARFGHRAIHDEPRHRMIVFGGVADTTAGPSDSSYSYDPGTRQWSALGGISGFVGG